MLMSSLPHGLDRNIEFFRITRTEAEKYTKIDFFLVERVCSVHRATKMAMLGDSSSEINPQGLSFTKVSPCSS